MHWSSAFRSTLKTNVLHVSSMYQSSPFRSTANRNDITGLDMCQVCTEAVHSAARRTRTISQVCTYVKYVLKHSVALWTQTCQVCTEAVHSVLWKRTWYMCQVCTEAAHSVALWTRTLPQVWTCVKYVPKQTCEKMGSVDPPLAKTWTRSVLSKVNNTRFQGKQKPTKKMSCSITSGWQLAPGQPSRILARACLPPSQRRTFHVDIKKMKLSVARPHKINTHRYICLFWIYAYIYILHWGKEQKDHSPKSSNVLKASSPPPASQRSKTLGIMNRQKHDKYSNKKFETKSPWSLCWSVQRSGHRLESPVTWSESFVIFPHLILLSILRNLFLIPILGLQSSCRSASDHQAGYRAPNRKVPSKHCQSGLLAVSTDRHLMKRVPKKQGATPKNSIIYFLQGRASEKNKLLWSDCGIIFWWLASLSFMSSCSLLCFACFTERLTAMWMPQRCLYI